MSDINFAMTHALPVTPSDTASLSQISKNISFMNTGGQTINVTMFGGKVTSIVLPSGFYPLAVTKVWNSGTTVTNIMIYW